MPKRPNGPIWPKRPLGGNREEATTNASTGCFLMGVTGPGISLEGDALTGSVSDDP
jgi:hypothetical protein